MAEKKKKMIFLPSKDSIQTSSLKKPIILLSDRDARDDTKEKSEKEKQPTIILKTREQSVVKEDRPVSPKNADLDFPHSETSVEYKERKIEQRPAPVQKSMKEPVKLLDENLDVHSAAVEYLSETNTHFTVIGVIGTQGVGKSLVLNLLAHSKNSNLCQKILQHNDDVTLEDKMDELSITNGLDSNDDNWLKFKMQRLEHIERNAHCTKGIDMLVTRDRIYLDCQALWSLSMVEEGGGGRGANATMAGLQLAAFMMSVCHVVIAVQDWVVDYNFVRYIQTAEMLRPTLTVPPSSSSNQEGSESAPDEETNPHLLLLHNRCDFENYTPRAVKELQDVYRLAFSSSSLQLHSGMYLYGELSAADAPVDQLCGGYTARDCGPPLNLFLLPEIRDDSDPTTFRGHPPLDQLVCRLRRQVFGAPRHQLGSLANLTEKAWFHFCNRAWEQVRASSFFIEYERLLP